MAAKLPKVKLSKGEETLALHLRIHSLAPANREYKFHDTRKWRFDFAWPKLLFAVEIEGLTHDGGRHQRLAGFEKDLEKYEAAMLDGWTIYRCSTAMVTSGRAVDVIGHMISRIQKPSKNVDES